MMKESEYYWYLLSNLPGFGLKSIHYIYKILNENNLPIKNLFRLDINKLQSLFPEIGRGKFSKANFSCFTQLDANNILNSNFERLKNDGVTIVGLGDYRYPKTVLQNMGENAPPILYCKGYLPLLNQKCVSIVGARDVGEFEIMITKSIAHRLADNGIHVTSGYAKGVDTSAHLGALEAKGTTTMILSFGTNHITIKRELKDFNLVKNALFISQFAPYEKFSGQNAMTRNKLVCAISKVIVVIKSGSEKDSSGKISGTFDAGKTALKMGIPVFVFSPQGLNPIPQGNMELIKIGAREFSNGMDIVNFFKEQSEQEFVSAIEMGDNKIQDKKVTISKTTKPIQTSLFD